MKKIIVLLVLVVPVVLKAQVSAEILKAKLAQADSVHVVSHDDLIKNGKVNPAAIKESMVLSQGSIQKLYMALTAQGNETGNRANTDPPHHGILIYKKGECSYIDVNFQTMGYTLSPDLKGTVVLTNLKSWKALYDFFRIRDIHYKMPEPGKDGY